MLHSHVHAAFFLFQLLCLLRFLVQIRLLVHKSFIRFLYRLVKFFLDSPVGKEHRIPVLFICSCLCFRHGNGQPVVIFLDSDISDRHEIPDLYIGKGKDTLNWFVHEFKPYIDANYRTQPDRAHTFIGGSSMGGLMSLYALLQYSDVFGRAAALSPSLWVAPEALTALVGRCKLAPGTVLYMDYGSKEMGNHDGMRKGFGEMCSRIFARGINLTARVVPGGNHSEASWEKQLPFVFHTLMYELE